MTLTESESQILKHLIESGRPEPMENAMGILNPTKDFGSTFEIANEMQNKNLVKLVYCVHPNTINVQLTLVGEKKYQDHISLQLK